MFGDNINLQSSNVMSVRYDMENQVMEVTFRRKGNIYHFFGVPPEVFNDFLNAPSKGRFLKDHIQDKYLYKKIQ